METLLHRHGTALRLVVFALIAALMLPSLVLLTPAAWANPETETSYSNADIDALRVQATQARQRLDQLAFETDLASENYLEAQHLLEETLIQIAETEELLTQSQTRLEAVSDQLSDRAVRAYQAGDLSFITFLFASSDFNDLVARVEALRIIMDNDAAIMREVRALRADIQTSMTRLEEKRETEREAAQRAQDEFETIQTSLDAQQRLLASLDGEVTRLIEEERRAIEAEQIRVAQARQEAAERDRLAREEAQRANQTASNTNQNPATEQPASAPASPNTPPANAPATPPPANNSNNAGSGNNNAGSGNNNAGTTTPPPATTSPGNSGPNLGRERPGVVTVARRFVGVTPYLWGGTTPAGFDCSGLVMFSYREAYGINLPRTSRQQFHAGTFIPPNRGDLMRPGDLVFFSRTGRPENIHHVGIFIGNNRMIHAPSSGRLVSEQTIWRSDFIGAVRP